MNNAIVGSSGHSCRMPHANAATPRRRHYEAFTPVQQTLIIPLVARALGGGLYPGHACGDEQASRLLRTLEIDGQAYLADRPTVLNVLWRTRLIRECAQAFFAKYPKAWGINLGCGLTDYFQWLNNGQNTWLDADLAEVMALRKTLLPAQMPRLRAGTGRFTTTWLVATFAPA